MITDGRRTDPGQIRFENIFSRIREPIRPNQAERRHKDRQRSNQAKAPDSFLMFLRQKKNQQERNQRQEDYQVQQRHRLPPANPIAMSTRMDPSTTQAA